MTALALLVLAQAYNMSTTGGDISRSAPLQLLDEGSRQGAISELNFTGAGVNCTRSSNRGNCTVAGGGAASFTGDAGSVIFIGANGQLAERNERLYYDNNNGKLGINTRSPQQALHIDGDGGSFLIRGAGDQRVMWHQLGYVGSGSLSAYNPKFNFGSIIAGGVGAPLIRVLYSDDGNQADAGGTATTERSIFEIEKTGTTGIVLDGNLRSMLEGFTRNNDYKPNFRISRYPDAELELGAGGMLAVAGGVVRDGGLVLVTTEASHAHKFRIGDRVYQSQQEGNFPLPSSFHVVTSTPSYNKFTYEQDGGDATSTVNLYYSIETDTAARREDSQKLSLYAHGHVFAEAIGTGDAGATAFSDTAARYPVVGGSVLVKQQDGGLIAQDDGSGTVSGTDVTGTITYSTGALALTFTTPPVGDLVWDYSHNASRLSVTGSAVTAQGWTTFGLPRWATVDLPSASGLTGHVVYDNTTGSLKYSNGSTWGAISGSGYTTIQDEGVPVAQQSTLNFSGPITVTDGSSKTTVTIDNASSSSSGLMTASAQTLGGRKSFPGTAIDTDASYTVASIDQLPTFVKNDSNTRHFYGSRLKPTFNFGASNANTTVNILEVSSNNTSTTGLGTVNLANFAYNDASKFEFRSNGAFLLNGSAGTSGQYLQSAGSSSPPTWVDAPAPTSWLATGSADDTTTSSSMAAMNSMTLTPGAGTYVVMFNGSIENTSGSGVNTIAIYVNGVSAGTSTRYSQNASFQSIPVSIITRVAPSAGQAVEVYWSTSTGTATVHYRTLTLIKVST